MTAQFADKVVLITGGGGGIGKAAAAALPRGGRARRAERHAGGGAGRRAGRARPAGERPCSCRAGPRREDGRRLAAAAVERFGGIDVLVNSTGHLPRHAVRGSDGRAPRRGARSILYPTYWASQAVVASMRERGGGAIVNVGSMWALDAIATTPTSAYSAAQAGRHVLTKNLAIELAADASGSTRSRSPSSRRRPTGAS